MAIIDDTRSKTVTGITSLYPGVWKSSSRSS